MAISYDSSNFFGCSIYHEYLRYILLGLLNVDYKKNLKPNKIVSRLVSF